MTEFPNYFLHCHCERNEVERGNPVISTVIARSLAKRQSNPVIKSKIQNFSNKKKRKYRFD